MPTQRTPQDALRYHAEPRPGKIEVVATKPFSTQADLSLAYSPGVAEPCREIARDPDLAFRYTARGNLVGVVTNGTAVLGLGNIGPLAGKPVMEGKGVLFKRFAGIDVFDIELDAPDPEDVIRAVKAMAPTFGAINLEDIAAPHCFEIEQRLREELDIPVFHDDQHGTAVITCAGLLNALELQGKRPEDARVAFCGAGAAAVAIARLAWRLGIRPENTFMADVHGVLYAGRDKLHPYMADFIRDTDARTVADIMRGADVFVGVSVAGTVTPAMVASMAPRPILFALANPDPEITYEAALAVRDDLIMATGRSDFPNQINNVLGFPYIFRGALDVRARKITEGMLLAASDALARLAREPVPDDVLRAYGLEALEYGHTYIIPKPFDPRALTWVATAVARAAEADGVARQPITDLEGYERRLRALQGPSYAVIDPLRLQARKLQRRIAFAEGTEPKIIQAADQLARAGVCVPVLLGHRELILRAAAQLRVDPSLFEIHDPEREDPHKDMADRLWQLRQRKGLTRGVARLQILNRHVYAMMLLHEGRVDGVVAGLTAPYPEVVRPALQILGPRTPGGTVSGVYAMAFRSRVLFFGDCTVNIEPTPEQLADIAVNTAAVAQAFRIEPRVALLSFSNFGDVRHARVDHIPRALRLLKQREVGFQVDGEMQANVAMEAAMRAANYPFCEVEGEPTVLIFPDLQSGNIAYKLLASVGGATAIGPILVGVSKPVGALSMGSDVPSIVDVATITASLEV